MTIWRPLSSAHPDIAASRVNCSYVTPLRPWLCSTAKLNVEHQGVNLTCHFNSVLYTWCRCSFPGCLAVCSLQRSLSLFTVIDCGWLRACMPVILMFETNNTCIPRVQIILQSRFDPTSNTHLYCTRCVFVLKVSKHHSYLGPSGTRCMKGAEKIPPVKYVIDLT